MQLIKELMEMAGPKKGLSVEWKIQCALYNHTFAEKVEQLCKERGWILDDFVTYDMTGLDDHMEEDDYEDDDFDEESKQLHKKLGIEVGDHINTEICGTIIIPKSYQTDDPHLPNEPKNLIMDLMHKAEEQSGVKFDSWGVRFDQDIKEVDMKD